MPERPKEDPTKKVAAGERRADANTSAVPDAAKMKSLRDRGDAMGALDSIRDQLGGGDLESVTDWKKQRVEWGRAVAVALGEPKGSVTSERPDMVDPMAMFAARAFERTDPETKRKTDEAGKNDPELKKVFDERSRGNEAARKAFAVLADRYPNSYAQGIAAKKFDAVMSGIGGQMKTKKDVYSSFGTQLDNLSRNKDLSRQDTLLKVDETLEALGAKMSDAAINEVAAYEGTDSEQRKRESRRGQFAELLSHVKSLVDLRNAMSKEIYGQTKSPDEVLAIAAAQEVAASDADGGKADKSPVRAAAMDGGKEVGERERIGRELLAELLRDGSSQINTSLRNTVPGAANSGFQDRVDGRFGTKTGIGSTPTFVDSSGKQARGFEVQKMLGQLGVNEVIEMGPVTEDTYEDRQVAVPKSGLMGMLGQKEMRVERVKTGTRRVIHGERVAGGKPEPLIELSYRTVDADDNGAYKDYSNRTGQMLLVAVRLPESLARRTLEFMKSDPTFARKMVEQIVVKQQGIPENTWKFGESNNDVPVRPPYEAWKGTHKGKANVYLRSSLDGPNDNKVHQEDIFPVE